MANHEERITYFGETDSRGKKIKFGIKAKDRTKHTYVIGKTGMGKSTLLENMAIQDIQNGEGLAFLDPHGSTAEKLLEYIPEERIQDVLYFAPFDMEYPISFNVMEDVESDKRHLVANGLMSVFEKIWEDAWSARMAYILNNTILALLEYPEATLLGINRMLADKEYRKKVVDNVQDPSVKSFWVDEFGKYTERFAQEATPAIQNKVGQFTSNALMRNIIGQPKSSFDLREMMDTRKILIVNLSKGRVGEGNANLLGSMLITKIYLAAMSRADVSATVKESLPNFYLYVDEFQSFANRSFADILSEARKYKLNLTIAHQYVEQMSEEVRAAVFGNVGTMISFRVGAIDAEIFEKEYAPTFIAEDLVNLGFTQMYLKLMIDGVSSQPFSATSLPPIQPIHASVKEKVIIFSREHYGKPRTLVEEKIKQWHEPISPPQQPKQKASNDTKKSINKKDAPTVNKSILPALTEEQLRQMKTIQQKPFGNASATADTHAFMPTQNLKKQNNSIPSILINQNSGYDTSALSAKSNLDLNRIPNTQQKESRNTISLSDLKYKQNIKNRQSKKEPSKENLLDLRKALSSVMKGYSKGDQSVGSAKEISSKPKIDQFDKTEENNKLSNEINDDTYNTKQTQQNIENKRKEVPEDTLRNILKVDDKYK